MHFPIAPERFDGRTETRLADHLHQRSKGEPRISAAFGVTRRFKVWTGAAYVTRTRDPIITNDVLYQLS